MPDPTPVVEPTPTPVASPESAPSPAVTPTPTPDPTPAPVVAKEPDWRDKRIAELTHKLNEARRAAPPAIVPQPVPATPAPQAPGESQAVFEARVAETAQQIASANEWNRTCYDVAQTGQKEFGKESFDKAIAAVNSVVNHADNAESQQFNEFLRAAVETGQAHKLIHELGANPGEVKRLMALPGAKRVVELTRMADKIATPTGDPEPSGAPKPITPVGSKGLHYDGVQPDNKDLGTTIPTREWMARREKQIEAKREAGVQMQ